MRVALVGVDEGGKRNQSLELCDEVDEHVTLTAEDLRSYFSLLPAATPDSQGSTDEVSGSVVDLQEVHRCGRAFADSWRNKAFDEELDALRADQPRIPRTVDVDLVRHAEGELGVSFRGREEARRELRRAFWSVIDQSTN